MFAGAVDSSDLASSFGVCGLSQDSVKTGYGNLEMR